MTRSSGGSLAEYHSDPEQIIRGGRRNKNQSERMAEEEEVGTSLPRGKTMRDYVMPSSRGAESTIVRPSIAANNFEIKPQLIQMIQNGYTFEGKSNQDANEHLFNFTEICDTVKYNGVSQDAIYLRLFPFSLRDKAKSWLTGLPPGSITTWDEMKQKFLGKYFPPARTARMRNDISSFLQEDHEQIYEAWDRFKEMLRKCPHHQFFPWMQIQIFYNGIHPQHRNLIDAAAGGTINNKTPEEAFQLIEDMTSNMYQYPLERRQVKRVAGAYEVDAMTALAARMEAVEKKLAQTQIASMAHFTQTCDMCGGGHPNHECQAGNVNLVEGTIENANFVSNFRRNNDPYSNTYNPGWRNHPNFAWANNNANYQQAKPFQMPGNDFQAPAPRYPPGFQNQGHKEEKYHDPAQGLTKTEALELELNQQKAHIKNLERQIAQMAAADPARQQGALPSNTEKNSREQVKAVTLRSGKEVEGPSSNIESEKEKELGDESNQLGEVRKSPKKKEKGKMEPPQLTEKQISELPFPERARKQQLDDKF